MLWLCLHCPRLPLDLLDRRGLDPAEPHAICEGNEQRRQIVFANDAARVLGVREGQSVAAARAFAPHLGVHPRTPLQEHAALERLAASAYGFSGAVAIAAPRAVLLEAGASLKLFGGLDALIALVRESLATLGLTARLTLAPTASAAELLAEAGENLGLVQPDQLLSAIGPISLAHTPLGADVVEGLARVGMRSVGDLAKLPRVALARRFREETVDYLDRLFGHAADPRPRWLPPATFKSGLELPAAFEHVEPLLFPLRRMTAELAASLAARDGGVQRFVLRLGHENRTATEVAIGLVEPSRDPNHLFELTRERLERLELPAPVLHLLLIADELPPFVPRGADLFDTGSREALPLPRLLERLRARLGADAVRELRSLPDHRPERASRMDPDFALGDAADGYVAAYAVREAARAHPAERPCWMLEAPVAIDPAQFQVLTEPERIESGWWDEADVSRDYYRAERRDGAIAWVYRERRAPHGWYLHGLFA